MAPTSATSIRSIGSMLLLLPKCYKRLVNIGHSLAHDGSTVVGIGTHGPRHRWKVNQGGCWRRLPNQRRQGCEDALGLTVWQRARGCCRPWR